MGQLDRSSKPAPCDFYASDQAGSVFNNRLANFEVQIPASGVTTGFGTNVIIRWECGASATISATRMLYMYMDSESALPAYDSAFIRFEDNSDASMHPSCFLEFVSITGATRGPTYFIDISNCLACNNKAGTVSSQDGYFKCRVGGSTRYIPLYTTVA